jgi:dGTPase
LSDPRAERIGDNTTSQKAGDHRTEFERDCDRILYSGAFRRLAVITQVVSPAGGHAFHNRLTHVLKVAQVGRCIAERLLREAQPEFIAKHGGLSPAVVQAAGMAHDLGHPPFGHIAEEELNGALLNAGEADGYEGNAQSFRIVSWLETRESGRRGNQQLGLDLTRATLNAILKYPRLRPPDDSGHPKFGAYRSEQRPFDFARLNSRGEERSLEAEIMDWADDITYAVHDLEDFYRAGKIPLDTLAVSRSEVEKFLKGMEKRLKGKIAPAEEEEYLETAKAILSFGPVSEAYTGRRTQRAALRGFASSIIHDCVCKTTLSEDGLQRPPVYARKVAILKQLTWHYVIEDSRLAAEQHGKRQVIRCLFEIFANAASSKSDWRLFPPNYQEQLEESIATPPRTAADYIASMGEQRAVELYSELAGMSLKPVTTGMAL